MKRKMIHNTSNKHAVTLISHYILQEFFGHLVPVKMCSRKVGEIYTDSSGLRQYEVQRNGSVVHI